MLVGFIIPLGQTVILRTSVTPYSSIYSRICSCVTLLKAGQRTIPFDVFRKEWGVMVHFISQSVFISRRVLSCDSLAHCMKKHQILSFFIPFCSTALLIMVLCTTNGEREEIVSLSFFFLNELLKLWVHMA